MRSEHTRRLFAGKARAPAVAQVQSGLVICVQTKHNDALTVYMYILTTLNAAVLQRLTGSRETQDIYTGDVKSQHAR